MSRRRCEFALADRVALPCAGPAARHEGPGVEDGVFPGSPSSGQFVRTAAAGPCPIHGYAVIRVTAAPSPSPGHATSGGVRPSAEAVPGSGPRLLAAAGA